MFDWSNPHNPPAGFLLMDAGDVQNLADSFLRLLRQRVELGQERAIAKAMKPTPAPRSLLKRLVFGEGPMITRTRKEAIAWLKTVDTDGRPLGTFGWSWWGWETERHHDLRTKAHELVEATQVQLAAYRRVGAYGGRHEITRILVRSDLLAGLSDAIENLKDELM